MIELSVIFGLYVLVSGYLFYNKDKTSREERADLEDRIMALSSRPESIVAHRAAQDFEPATVSYMDERAEAGQNGDVDLVGDD